MELPSRFEFTIEDVTAIAQALYYLGDVDISRITNRRVGRVLGRLRLRQAPRPGGRGSRRWAVTLGDLAWWGLAYGLPMPTFVSGAVGEDQGDSKDTWPWCSSK